MAHKSDPAVTVQDHENLIQGVAKHFLQKVYGPDGMPWGTKFSELEELAIQIGQAVSRGMINQALANQAQAVPQAAETCGVCGEEPKRYCPKCRAAFFPSVPESGN